MKPSSASCLVTLSAVIENGQDIFHGEGLCVTCHGADVAAYV